MLKNKYQRLNRLEKKEARKEYRNASDANNHIYKSIRKIRILSVFGLIYSGTSFIIDFYFNTIMWYDYVLDAALLVFCVIFLLKCSDIINKQVNDYLIKKKK